MALLQKTLPGNEKVILYRNAGAVHRLVGEGCRSQCCTTENCRRWVKGYWCCNVDVFAWFPVYDCCWRGTATPGQPPWPVCGCPRDPGIPDYPCYFQIPPTGNPVISVLGTCYHIDSATLVENYTDIPEPERIHAVGDLVAHAPGDIRIAQGGCSDQANCLECPDCCTAFRVLDGPYCLDDGGNLPTHCCECPSEYELVARFEARSTRTIDSLCIFGCGNNGDIAPTLTHESVYTEDFHFRVRCVGRTPGQSEGQLVGECVNATYNLQTSTMTTATVIGCGCDSSGGPTQLIPGNFATTSDSGSLCDIHGGNVLAPCSLGPSLAARWMSGLGDGSCPPPNPGESVDGRRCNVSYARDVQPGDEPICGIAGTGTTGTYSRSGGLDCFQGGGDGSCSKTFSGSVGASCAFAGGTIQFGARVNSRQDWSWSYQIIPTDTACFDNPCGEPGTQAPIFPLFLTPDRQKKKHLAAKTEMASANQPIKTAGELMEQYLA